MELATCDTMHTKDRLLMRARGGFTLLEVLIVLVIAGIVLGTAIPSISRSMAQTTMQRAASNVSGDLHLARSMAARQRKPVRISIDTAQKVFRVRDLATPTTIYSERHFGAAGEHPVLRMLVSDTSLVIYPSGLATGPLTVQLFAATNSRRVTMTRAGMVRISGS